MSREIKFRTWYTNRNSFYIFGSEAIRLLISKPHGSEVVIEQSTGLKDVNGVNIYENDIIRLDGVDYSGFEFVEYLQIVFSQGCFCFESPNHVQMEDVVDGDVVNVEVVGNIHNQQKMLERNE